MREKFVSSCQHLNWNLPKGTCQSSVLTPRGCVQKPLDLAYRKKSFLEDSLEVNVPFAFCIKPNWLHVREKVQVFYGSRVSATYWCLFFFSKHISYSSAAAPLPDTLLLFWSLSEIILPKESVLLKEVLSHWGKVHYHSKPWFTTHKTYFTLSNCRWIRHVEKI